MTLTEQLKPVACHAAAKPPDVANANADGYTLAYGTNGTHAINHTLYKNPGFDAVKDFEPISRFTQIALLLVTNPSIPAKSAKELIAYLKANPGKVSVATQGGGTTSHLTAELFMQITGTEMNVIPYRGSAPALVDLIGNNVDVFFDNIGVSAPHHRAGRLRILAVADEQRSAQEIARRINAAGAKK